MGTNESKLVHEKCSPFTDRTIWIFLFLTALLFVPSPGTTDLPNFWERWTRNSNQYGIIDGYRASRSDYPPICAAILHYTTKIGQIVTTEKPIFWGIKWTLFFFWLASTLIFNFKTKTSTLSVFDKYFFAASLLLNSVALAYLDIMVIPFLLLAFFSLIENKKELFTLFFALACSIKWPPIMLAPIILIYFFKLYRSQSGWPTVRGPFWVAFIFSFLLLAFFPLQLPLSFARALSHASLSAMAFNLSWIVQHFLHVFMPDVYGPLAATGENLIIYHGKFNINMICKIVFFLHYFLLLASAFIKMKSVEDLIWYCFLGYLAYFTFNAGVHENHLVIALPLLAVLAAVNPAKYRTNLIFWSLFTNANLLFMGGLIGGGLGFPRVIGIDLVLLFALLEVVSFYSVFIPAVWVSKRSYSHKTGVRLGIFKALNWTCP